MRRGVTGLGYMRNPISIVILVNHKFKQEEQIYRDMLRDIPIKINLKRRIVYAVISAC